MKTLLLVDCNYICYRCFHSTGGLSFNGESTGVTFGFLRDIFNLTTLYNTQDICFCWDFGEPFRVQHLSTYKQARKERREKETKEQQEARVELMYEIEKIRNNYLEDLGYPNNFYITGFEADDLIAHCKNQFEEQYGRVVIVSSDKDMYQLLDRKTIIYNLATHKEITFNWFQDQYGIYPSQWITVKAMAGCNSDSIPGIKGIGEKTAVQYLLKKLKPSTKAYKSILANKDIVQNNIPLVELPYPLSNLPNFDFKPHTSGKGKWNQLLKQLGMQSLRQLVSAAKSHQKSDFRAK